jgi:hypothetical protein
MPKAQPFQLCEGQYFKQTQMKIFNTISGALLSTLLAVAATAQDAVSFKDFLSGLPQPAATLQQAMGEQPAAAETVLAAAAITVKNGTAEAYRPLYAYFLKTLSGGQTNASAFSAAERTLYRTYSIGAKGLSADNQYLQFQLVVEDRPFLGSGLLSWGLPGKFSGAEKDLFLQALALEKMFDHSLLKPNAQKSKLDFGNSDPALNAIHEKFNREFAALLKRNVKTAEGFIIEVEDPGKAIAAYKAYGRKRQEHFAKGYSSQFATWQLQYKRLLAIAEKLDALSAQPSAKTPVGAILLSDLQGRMWNAATHLFMATNRLWQDIMIAQIGQKQVQEAIEIYTAYKANIQ